ncbi:isochorismatase family protein [Quadrisphaera sp. DSM 44207]|uniref:isochorismatase family protein n=1 Tax=Quadrisphaera sp. DSM 44207 TaxID=1881057 RepID=UPI00088F4636|nr:isochorismatase family protein [Quadrisphaera sp. DSM 44207]SDQ34463.1 Nicotinamidase-related amidase [Quadrisphaera sp. DSM 44207]
MTGPSGAASCGRPLPDGAWLVLVDVQRVFADDASPWCTPGLRPLLPRLRDLAGAFPGRTASTRFVAPARPQGAWVDYYAQWPFALQPPQAPLYDLLPGVVPDGTPVVTRTTFGKWDEREDGLRPLTGGRALVLAGVSTDCCVLSTALAAADAGVAVHVVADACAAPVAADHERALAALDLYAPLVTLTTASAVLAAASG